MKAKDLFGKQVIDVDAKVVGKIVDVDIDVSKASIISILVKSGLTKTLSILPQDVDKVGDKVVLKTAREKLQKA